MLPAIAGADSPHRQGAEKSRVRVTPGGLYLPTLGIHIPDLRAQQLRCRLRSFLAELQLAS